MAETDRPSIKVAVVMEREAQPNRWEDWRFSVVDVLVDEGGLGESRVLRDDGHRRQTLHAGFELALCQ